MAETAASKTTGTGKGKKANRKVRIIAITAAALCILSALFPFFQDGWRVFYSMMGLPFPEESGFSIHFLDVRSADAAVIRCDGYTVLIDGGTYGTGIETYRYLRHMGVEELDAMINTHPDSDHLGGFSEILTRMPVKEYWEGEVPQELLPQTEEYVLTRKALKEKGVPIRTAVPGETLSFGKVQIQVLGPVKKGSDSNNNSLVLQVCYEGYTVLMMGDAGEEEEESLIEAGCSLQCDILKVGHHGSNTSTGRKLLKQAAPTYGVISVGKERGPGEKTLQRLEENNIQIYRTDTDGNIVLHIDGEGVTFTREKDKEDSP